jgi:hypothetical protein
MDDDRKWSNRVFAFGLILASVALVGVSYGAWRHARAQT